ncbi:hypothetical protein COBT_000289 [Conglomerata obtusa]
MTNLHHFKKIFNNLKLLLGLSDNVIPIDDDFNITKTATIERVDLDDNVLDESANPYCESIFLKDIKFYRRLYFNEANEWFRYAYHRSRITETQFEEFKKLQIQKWHLIVN